MSDTTQKHAVVRDADEKHEEAPLSTRPPASERLGWGPHDPLGALHAAPPPVEASLPRSPKAESVKQL
jgi:hypothetical protein